MGKDIGDVAKATLEVRATGVVASMANTREGEPTAMGTGGDPAEATLMTGIS